jgi:hypothetical protein
MKQNAARGNRAEEKWTKLRELPQSLILDGRRVRYKKRVLGRIRSGWGRGLWLTDGSGHSGIFPWIPPNGKSIAEVSDDLEVEYP